MRKSMGLVALVGLWSLGCSGMDDAMEAGMVEAAQETIDDARDLVAKCDDGKPKNELNGILDKVQKKLDSGEMGGIEAAFAAGMVQGGVEDNGCDANDAKEIGTLYPDLVK